MTVPYSTFAIASSIAEVIHSSDDSIKITMRNGCGTIRATVKLCNMHALASPRHNKNNRNYPVYMTEYFLQYIMKPNLVNQTFKNISSCLLLYLWNAKKHFMVLMTVYFCTKSYENEFCYNQVKAVF